MNRFDYAAPTSLYEVFALLDRYGDEARLIAGGTALIILMRQRLVQPGVLVSLGEVPGLSDVEVHDGGIRIGALATHREVETSPLVRERLPVLAETLRHVATIRIRNVATLGGNLAHADPNLDPPVTLIALGASVEVVSSRGERIVPVEEFFTDYYETVLRPGEVLRAIRVPHSLAPSQGGEGGGEGVRTACVFHKFLPRTADDYATVAVATVLTLDDSGEYCQDVRLALGAVGSTPLRARQTEAALRGQRLTPQTIREAAAIVASEIDPISDVRGSAEYKRDMAEVWVRRSLEQAVAQAGEQLGS